MAEVSLYFLVSWILFVFPHLTQVVHVVSEYIFLQKKKKKRFGTKLSFSAHSVD